MPASTFPKLFHEYYAIHKTIDTIIAEMKGSALDPQEVERRVRAAHPELDMGPATLAAAVRQALKDTEGTVGRSP